MKAAVERFKAKNLNTIAAKQNFHEDHDNKRFAEIKRSIRNMEQDMRKKIEMLNDMYTQLSTRVAELERR